jgi:nicotinamidase-related amidase
MPEFDSLALVSIDVQRDLLDGQAQEVPGTSAAARVIADLRDAFLRAGSPIVHIVRLYREDGSNADLCRRGPMNESRMRTESRGASPSSTRLELGWPLAESQLGG